MLRFVQIKVKVIYSSFNNMAQMCIEEMREEGLIESDDDEEAELAEAEPQSELLN